MAHGDNADELDRAHPFALRANEAEGLAPGSALAFISEGSDPVYVTLTGIRNNHIHFRRMGGADDSLELAEVGLVKRPDSTWDNTKFVVLAGYAYDVSNGTTINRDRDYVAWALPPSVHRALVDDPDDRYLDELREREDD